MNLIAIKKKIPVNQHCASFSKIKKFNYREYINGITGNA